MKNFFPKLIFIALFFYGILPLSAQQEARQFTLKTDYLVFTPEGYDSDESREWPLILFLHGAGERGSDIEKVKVHGPPKIVGNQPDFPFIVVSPQCPVGRWWSTEILNGLLDEVIDQYQVDKSRVYLTGLSMGGFGTWALAQESAERFAAIAPICGGGETEQIWRLRNTPTWVFHGAKDQVVPLGSSEEMVAALKPFNDEVKFTIYPDADHDSWTVTYNNPELYEWFLSHQLTPLEAISLTDQQLDRLTGTYRHESGMEMEITSEGGKLYGQAMGQPKMPLAASSEKDFFIPAMPNIQLQFKGDGARPDKAILYAEEKMEWILVGE